jgi:hypothetical protein
MMHTMLYHGIGKDDLLNKAEGRRNICLLGVDVDGGLDSRPCKRKEGMEWRSGVPV